MVFKYLYYLKTRKNILHKITIIEEKTGERGW